jgi:hypothetical protein
VSSDSLSDELQPESNVTASAIANERVSNFSISGDYQIGASRHRDGGRNLNFEDRLLICVKRRAAQQLGFL